MLDLSHCTAHRILLLLQIFFSSFAYIQERPFHYCNLLSPKLCSFLDNPTVKDSYMLDRVVSSAILGRPGSTKVSRRFRWRISLPLQSRRVSRKQKSILAVLFILVYFPIYFSTRRWRRCVPSKFLFFRGLHDVIQVSKKTEAFIATALRKLNVVTRCDSGSAVLGVVVVFLRRALRIVEGGKEQQDFSVEFIHPTNHCTSCHLQATSR
jgi:hypothetical protein